MTLTEALADYESVNKTGYPTAEGVEVLAEAARRWASFPTDDDIEVAAKAARQWQKDEGFIAADLADLIPEMRVALEAVKR